MKFDLQVRQGVRDRISALAEKMGAWDHQPRISPEDEKRIRDSVRTFPHTTSAESLRAAGVDGSGAFPLLTYADSYVHLAVAHGTVYESAEICGLRELETDVQPVVEFTWLPEDQTEAQRSWRNAFAAHAGTSVEQVIEDSDYRLLKAKEVGKQQPASLLLANLIQPHSSDSGNIGIQLRSTAELGAACRLLGSELCPNVLFLDGTMSLPMVTRQDASLFLEHLKRLCAVKARARGIALVHVSKSHGLPGMEQIESLVSEATSTETGQAAEHWCLRLPRPGEDTWRFPGAENRRLPPAGAVSYLVRFHGNTPILRVDLDETYWQQRIAGRTLSETEENEGQFFSTIDYCCHDQRCYGYPYPIKAGHDRASLTEGERLSLQKQVIDAAVMAGMRRKMFRDVSRRTGHA